MIPYVQMTQSFSPHIVLTSETTSRAPIIPSPAPYHPRPISLQPILRLWTSTLATLPLIYPSVPLDPTWFHTLPSSLYPYRSISFCICSLYQIKQLTSWIYFPIQRSKARDQDGVLSLLFFEGIYEMMLCARWVESCDEMDGQDGTEGMTVQLWHGG